MATFVVVAGASMDLLAGFEFITLVLYNAEPDSVKLIYGKLLVSKLRSRLLAHRVLIAFLRTL